MIRRRRIAQLVEQGVDNAQVRGSSPFGSSDKIICFLSLLVYGGIGRRGGLLIRFSVGSSPTRPASFLVFFV